MNDELHSIEAARLPDGYMEITIIDKAENLTWVLRALQINAAKFAEEIEHLPEDETIDLSHLFNSIEVNPT